jgi:hypothetical protein
MTITGDLVKCNDTGSLGIITKILPTGIDFKHYTYQVLWPEGTMTFSSEDDVTPLPEKEYAA